MNPQPEETLIEQCLSPADISAKLKLSVDTVRRLFENEEGVLRIGRETRRVGQQYRRHYFVLRIPVSVFQRVEDRLRQKKGRM
jgi:hypothetical protein